MTQSEIAAYTHKQLEKARTRLRYGEMRNVPANDIINLKKRVEWLEYIEKMLEVGAINEAFHMD